MICPTPKCGHTLAVIRTVRGRETESRDLICQSCGYRATSLSFLILRDDKRPRGATSRSLISLAEEGSFDEFAEKLRGMLPKPSKSG